jgi:hypothetical protein
MNKCIVTIGRMFGSGGGEIARKTAELLGVKCYDKELIIKSAEASGISPEQLETVDERATNSFLYSLAMASYNGQIAGITGNDMIMSDRLFSVQSDIIRNIAGEGSAVIIGRCADDILAGCDGLLKVFVYAPLENRIKRIMEQHSLEESEAKALIKKTDKKRASYYNFYTGKSWGASENYNICIDTSRFGIEKSARIIASAAEVL